LGENTKHEEHNLKNTGKIFLLAFIMGILFVLPASAQKTKKEFQKMYMTYLTKLKYNPSVDEDGDIMFKVEGFTHYIIVDEKEPQLFVLLRVVNIEKYPAQKCLEAANYANRTSDGGMVYISKDGRSVVVSLVTIVLKPTDWQKVFEKAMDLLTDIEVNFFSQLK
jgi:hypothetical protein